MVVPVSLGDSAQRFHIAIAVEEIQRSIAEYSKRLGSELVVVVKNEYALWHASFLNLSILKTGTDPGIRHIGWKDAAAGGFVREIDINGLVWEHFSAPQQAEEIRRI